MEKGVFWMKVDPIRGSQASIKPFFDGFSTMSKIAPSERGFQQTQGPPFQSG
jgi:hypothetical protein